jgi:hypothetical protein
LRLATLDKKAKPLIIRLLKPQHKDHTPQSALAKAATGSEAT